MESANTVYWRGSASKMRSTALLHANRCVLKNLVASSILLYGALSAVPALGANWFDGIQQQCVSNLSTTFAGGGPLDQLVAPTDRISFSGRGPVRLTYRLLSADLPNPKSHYRTTVLTLDDRAKADLRLALTRAADKDPLPVVEGLANVVLTIAPDAVTFTWEAIWASLKAVLDVKPLSVEGVIPLVANGGQITRDVVIQRKSNKQLWGDVYWYYHVSVGTETRSILLASCRMPVEAAPTVILTKADSNNKRLTLKQGIWEIYDLEEKKYDTPIQQADQDAEWIYANEMSGGAIVNQHRFSNSGAGWQTISSGRWRYFVKDISFE
jgi:hypothetical protein